MTGEDRPFATIGYEADLIDESDAWLRLHYRADGEPLDYRIQLVTTIPNYGGHRLVVHLPAVAAMTADRRGAWRSSIFLPVISFSFFFFLNYESCQESGKYDRLFCVYPCAIWATLTLIPPPVTQRIWRSF